MLPVVAVVAAAVPIIAATSAVGVAVRHFEGEYRTMKARKVWAGARGFTFQPESHSLATSLHSAVPGIMRATATFTGALDDGSSVYGASCNWEVDRGKFSTTHRRDVAALRLNNVNFPLVVIHRRRRGPVLRPMLRSVDVLNVEHPTFSRRWKVASPSARLAHDLLHPRMVEQLIQAPRWVEAVWFSFDAIFLSSRSGATSRIDASLDMLSELASLVPHFTMGELRDGVGGTLYPRPGRRGLISL